MRVTVPLKLMFLFIPTMVFVVTQETRYFPGFTGIYVLYFHPLSHLTSLLVTKILPRLFNVIFTFLTD